MIGERIDSTIMILSLGSHASPNGSGSSSGGSSSALSANAVPEESEWDSGTKLKKKFVQLQRKMHQVNYQLTSIFHMSMIPMEIQPC